MKLLANTPPPGRTALPFLLPIALSVLSIAACGPGPGSEPGERGGGSGDAPASMPDIGSGSTTVDATGDHPQPGTAWVVFGTDTVVAEVARTAEQRAQGLMYREEVPDGTGMLFVFEEAAERSFWMENTYVALDIAFMDPDFRIVDIQQMEPRSTELTDSAAPAMFALEVRQGWLAEHGIEVGDQPEIVFGG